MSNGNDREDFPPGEGDTGADENGNGVLENGRPAVAAAPSKTIFIIGAAVICLGIVLKSLFFSSPPEAPKPEAHKREQVPAAVKNPDELGALNPSNLPAPPAAMQLPPPPPAPPALPSAPTLPSANVTTTKGPTDQALQARIKSPMVVSGGGRGPGLSSKESKVAAANDPNLAFAQAVGNSDVGTPVVATNIGDLNYTIAQGKFIHAVMESAINSDLPAPIRAIVSHDIYAEAGKIVLIPKGSRLIGVYNSQIKHGQGRIYIIWTRVIRPDGVDVAIDSPGVDTLGRAGLAGDVNNRYFEMFSTAILTSAIDIGIAGAGQGLFGNQQQTTTSGGSSGTTVTSSPSATAMQNAVQNMGTVSQSIIGNTTNLQPTISVDQGTQVNVFVNHDLIFPSKVLHKSRFVE